MSSAQIPFCGVPHRGGRNGRRRGEVLIILDNLSAHKSQVVRDFLAAHPNVHFHFMPTYSSWLNQVEIWFSKVERDVIARGIFTSVKDLARKLRRYINAYSANSKQSTENSDRRAASAGSAAVLRSVHQIAAR